MGLIGSILKNIKMIANTAIALMTILRAFLTNDNGKRRTNDNEKWYTTY